MSNHNEKTKISRKQIVNGLKSLCTIIVLLPGNIVRILRTSKQLMTAEHICYTLQRAVSLCSTSFHEIRLTVEYSKDHTCPLRCLWHFHLHIQPFLLYKMQC